VCILPNITVLSQNPQKVFFRPFYRLFTVQSRVAETRFAESGFGESGGQLLLFKNSVQSTGRTRSSPLVTLARPPVSSTLQITNRSFTSQVTLKRSMIVHHLTSPMESAPPFFISSTSFCSLSSWFTSSCAYHFITATTFALITYHSLYLSLRTYKTHLFHKSFPP